MVEDVDGRRARGERDVVAVQLVAQVAGHIVQRERTRDRVEGGVDHLVGKSYPTVLDGGAEVGQHRHHTVVVDLHADRLENNSSLTDDPLHERVIE
jgi:hypothetical protein